jgi:hypothetical protein
MLETRRKTIANVGKQAMITADLSQKVGSLAAKEKSSNFQANSEDTDVAASAAYAQSVAALVEKGGGWEAESNVEQYGV